MGEWTFRPFGDLTVNLDSRRIPVKESDRRSGPYPYYGASGVVDHIDSYIFDGLNLLVAEDGENLRTRKLPIAFLADGKYWVNNHAHIVQGNDLADTKFLCYALQCADIASYLTGSTMPKLTQGNLNRIPIYAPGIGEQKAIAAILGSLDDKIDLNRRMNETLEAMARAIFKDWFVDFGPTRAKMEGRAPYLAQEIWDLFPDALDDEGKPAGWKIGQLGEATSYLSRGISPSYTEHGGVLVLNQKCIRDRRVDWSKGRRHDPLRRATTGRLVQKGDVLVNSTGVGTLGRVAQVMSLAEDTIVDSHVTIVRTNNNIASWNYIGANLSGREGEIECLGEGSTGQTELSRARLAQLEILLPQKTLISAFDCRTLPLRAKATANENESRTLAKTRDLLLPKLMSGEIRGKDAEKAVEKIL